MSWTTTGSPKPEATSKKPQTRPTPRPIRVCGRARLIGRTGYRWSPGVSSETVDESSDGDGGGEKGGGGGDAGAGERDDTGHTVAGGAAAGPARAIAHEHTGS